MTVRPFLLICLTYLLITIAYGVINPLLEGPDASGHFFVAVHIAEQGELPDLSQGYDDRMGQEVLQSPLYYWLGSWLIRPIPLTNARETFVTNPFVQMGDASATANINHTLRPPNEAWQGPVLAAHILRLLSTAFGLGTLILIYRIGRLMWPNDATDALLASGLVAMLPQFNFLHSYINNDTAVIFFSTLTLYTLQLVIARPTEQQPLWHYCLLGLAAGAAFLSKGSGMIAILFVPLALLLAALWARPFRQRLVAKLAVYAATITTVCGWLWWRNYQLYGDITATSQFAHLLGSRSGEATQKLLTDFDSVLQSSIAVFGWFNLVPPTPIYWYWYLIGLIGLTALLIGLIRRLSSDGSRLPLQGVVSFAWFAAVLTGLIYFMLQTRAGQGRLLFPAIAPLALAIGGGLAQLLPTRLRGLPLVGAGLTTLYCLFAVIRPAYQPPAYLADIPDGMTVLNVDLGNGTVLVAAQVDQTTLEVGGSLSAELLFRADRQIAQPQRLLVQLLTPDGQDGGKYFSFPAGGLFPATLWEPGRLVPLSVTVPINPAVDAPLTTQLRVTWIDEESQTDVGYSEIAAVKIVPTVWPEAVGLIGGLGDGIELVSAEIIPPTARPGDQVMLNIVWRVTGLISADYTALVHLGDPNQPPAATGDSQPRQGRYPTSLWQPGEIINDSYTINLPPDLPPGQLALRIGMYNQDERLPINPATAQPTTYALEVGSITINPE